MIISLKEDFDKELGTSLPMISRAGKSTIPQHLCFNNAPGNKKEFNFTKKEEKEDDDFSLLLGDKQKPDLKSEMNKIAEAEKKKLAGKGGARGKGQSQAVPNRTTGGFFVPFRQKFNAKDTPDGKLKSASFSATSREAWATSHASKTNAPEVGKYKPKFSQVEKKELELRIKAPQKNTGAARIMQRELQHTHWCDKVLKVVNTHLHPGKRAMNVNGQNEQGEGDSTNGANEGNQQLTGNNLLSLNIGLDGDRNVATPNHVNSTRRVDLVGSNQVSPKAKKGAHGKASSIDCTTYYMPNGQPMQKSPLNRQALQHYHVEHWQKFSSPVYDTVVSFENYHVVKDKNTANFYIQENKVKSYLSSKQANIRRFERQNNRKQIDTFVNLNESRFEPIEKSPQNLSKVKKVTGLSFQGYRERQEIWPEGDQATFYDANKEFTMKGLRQGALPWKRMTNRTVVNPVDTETPEESFDHMKATEVKTTRVKPRSIALASFGKQLSRDDKLLKTSDAYSNVLLENTKAERELEIQARKEQHKKYLNLGIM